MRGKWKSVWGRNRKIYLEILWSSCGQSGVISVSDNPLFQLVRVIKICTSPSNAQSQLNFRILIFFTWHFWNSSPFLCLGWPPLLVSVFSVKSPSWYEGAKVVLYSGFFAQLCRGEVGAFQTNTVEMCGECSQWMDHTRVATVQGSMHFLSPRHKVPGFSVSAQSWVGHASPQGSCL